MLSACQLAQSKAGGILGQQELQHTFRGGRMPRCQLFLFLLITYRVGVIVPHTRMRKLDERQAQILSRLSTLLHCFMSEP